MRYRIGEVAEFFGMTKEGIRYYERKGIICSERDARTGYRYYPRMDITRLKEIRMYEGLGFSLSDALAMSGDVRYDEVEERLEGKLEELRRKEEEIIRVKEGLERQREAVLGLKQGKIEVKQVPPAYFLLRAPDEASGKTDAEREEIAQARGDEKEWIRAMPSVMLCARQYDRQLRPVSGEYGSLVLQSAARELGLPTRRAVALAGGRCVCGAAQAPVRQKPPIDHLTAWARAHGYRICGDIYAVRRFVYHGEDGKQWAVHQFYLPVQEQGSNKGRIE